MSRSYLVLLAGAAVFTVFLFWQLPRALPLIDWGPSDFDYEEAVEEIRNHLGIHEVWEIESIHRFQKFDDSERRRALGNGVVNRLIADGRFVFTTVKLSDGSLIRFDPKGRVSGLLIPGSQGETIAREEVGIAIREFVAKFLEHRPDVEFEMEGREILFRQSEYSNLSEHIRFRYSGERLTRLFFDYRRTVGSAPPPSFSKYGHVISGVAYVVLLGFCLACFAGFLVRLKSEPEAPVTTLMLISLFVGAAAILSFQGRVGFPYLIEIPIHALFPFLALGLLGYGRSLDVQIQGGAGTASFINAFQGRLSPVVYGQQLLTGALLLPWSLGVFALTLVVLELAAPMTLLLQPTDFFLQMLQSRQPAVAGSLYFTLIAVLEEGLYRLCGALLILRLTKRKWIAILIPSIFYAAAHAGLSFLPPQEPLIFKLVACVAMGCVWGIAFFRFGFLSVLIAHYLCDLTLVGWFFQPAKDSYLTGIAIMAGILALPILIRLIRLACSRLSGPRTLRP
ncbi:MAG: hypothetical protein ACI8UO_004438 [Verrucomicrobiales bacterium]|jgi:hypothetical protein